MLRFLPPLIVVFSVTVLDVCAQENTQKTNEIVAALDKTKYKKKEKKNVSVEIYVDVKNASAIKNSPADYAGTYSADGYRLDLRVAKSGEVEGGGFDSLAEDGKAVKFTLRNARIDGALLTATKVYENGEIRKFDAVFVTRTEKSGRNENSIDATATRFGIGYVETSTANPESRNRMFLEKN